LLLADLAFASRALSTSLKILTCFTVGSALEALSFTCTQEAQGQSDTPATVLCWPNSEGHCLPDTPVRSAKASYTSSATCQGLHMVLRSGRKHCTPTAVRDMTGKTASCR
jgi:hypothetical protein